MHSSGMMCLMCPCCDYGGTQWVPPAPGRGHGVDAVLVTRESTVAGWLGEEGTVVCLLKARLCHMSHLCPLLCLGQKFKTQAWGSPVDGHYAWLYGGRKRPSPVPHPSGDFVPLPQLGSNSPWWRGLPQSSVERQEMVFNISKQFIENLLLPGAGPDPATLERNQDRHHPSAV